MGQRLEDSIRKYTKYTVFGGLGALGLSAFIYLNSDSSDTYGGGVNFSGTINIPQEKILHSSTYERNVRDAGIAAKVGLGAWALAAPFVIYLFRKDAKSHK